MTCPRHRPRPYGPPKRQPSGFVDQLVTCAACGWVGVVSELAERAAGWQQEAEYQAGRAARLQESLGKALAAVERLGTNATRHNHD